MRWVGALLLACLPLCGSVALATPAGEEIERLIAGESYRQAIERLERDHALSEGRRAYLLARAYLGAGDWKRALEHAEDATREMPDDVDAQLIYAKALRTKMDSVSKVRAIWSLGKYKSALARALELEPDNVDARTEEIGYLTYAPGIAGGDKSRAQARIVELEQLDFKQAMQMQVGLSRASGDDDGWLRALRRLAEHDPEDEQARFRLALTLAHLDRYAEADPLLRELEGSDAPEMALHAIYQLGRSRIVGKYEIEQGVGYFERYLAALGEAPAAGLPSRAAAHWRLGEGRALLGETDRARSSLQLAVRLDPELLQARNALDQLDR